jgi:hypothetical protein
MKLLEAGSRRQAIQAAMHREMRGTSLSDSQLHAMIPDREVLHLTWAIIAATHRRPTSSVKSACQQWAKSSSLRGLARKAEMALAVRSNPRLSVRDAIDLKDPPISRESIRMMRYDWVLSLTIRYRYHLSRRMPSDAESPFAVPNLRVTTSISG